MKRLWRAVIGGLLALNLTACAGAKVTRSDFDGSTQIRSDYGWCENRVKMTLVWNSKMPTDVIRLDAAADGAYLARGLHFNIDGKIVDLVPNGQPSVAIEDHLVETSYLVRPELIDAIVQAKKVMYRWDMAKDYQEGLLRDDPAGAVPNFEAFMTIFRQSTNSEKRQDPSKFF
jgi:hypothetical protein